MLCEVTSSLLQPVSPSLCGCVKLFLCHRPRPSPRPAAPAPPSAQDGAGPTSGRSARDVTAPPLLARARAREARLKVSAAAPPPVPPGPGFCFRFRPALRTEDMAALGRVSRLLLRAAAPRSPQARGIAAAAAHEEGGGNGAPRGEGGAGAGAALPLRAGALRRGDGAWQALGASPRRGSGAGTVSPEPCYTGERGVH